MNRDNSSPSLTARVNCNIKGNAAQALMELKKRGIVSNNREAVVSGLLALQEKVTKSDLEKSKLRSITEQSVYLRPWDEVIGTLDGTEINDAEITVLLTCTYQKHIAIAIEKDQPEIEQLQQQLKELLGRKVAILRTDNPQKPFVIRTLNNETSTTAPQQARPHSKKL